MKTPMPVSRDEICHALRRDVMAPVARYSEADIRTAVYQIVNGIPRRRGYEDDVWNWYATGKRYLLPWVDGTELYDWAVRLLIERLGL